LPAEFKRIDAVQLAVTKYRVHVTHGNFYSWHSGWIRGPFLWKIWTSAEKEFPSPSFTMTWIRSIIAQNYHRRIWVTSLSA
jgi:hypothetical protein